MVHELVHTAWNWTVAQFELTLGSDLAGKLTLIGLLAICVCGSALLYHFVEEPARRWMRRMVGVRKPPVDAPADAGHSRLQQIHGVRETRTPTVSARAG
jgi:peptidoglycan/LPS O-acetylase OafA/YrhL